jgi:hypothetical protein
MPSKVGRIEDRIEPMDEDMEQAASGVVHAAESSRTVDMSPVEVRRDDGENFDGEIGLILKWKRDQAYTMIAVIDRIIPWSPAMWEGTTRIGDVLTSVDGYPIQSPIDTEHLFGPVGSECRISVLRPRADRKVEYQFLGDFEGPLWSKPMKRDRQYRERPSGVVIVPWPHPAKYQLKSLYFLGLDWSLRKLCIFLHESMAWQVFCVLCILVNLVLLSMSDPLEIRNNPDSPIVNRLDLANFGLANFFVFEALVKIIANGLAKGHNAYLDNWLNRIDFLVVLSSVADICIFALKYSLVPLINEAITFPYEYTTFVTSFKALRAIRSVLTAT